MVNVTCARPPYGRPIFVSPVFSVFVALILAVILGAVGGAIGGAFHRLEAIRGIDGLLGVFVHVVVTVVVIYLAISALVTLDNAFEPTLKSANLTLSQVNQLENWILSNPITSAMVSKQDLQALKNAANKSSGASIDSVAGIHQLQQIYVDFLQPQLHSSRVVPIILSIGSHIPVIGHVGLTPQAVNTLGGYGARGREELEAQKILRDAAAVDQAGAFCIVVEGVMEDIATQAARSVSAPVIGIGASAECDGQVLVIDDMLGMFERTPRFVKRYDDLATRIGEAARLPVPGTGL